MVKSVWKWLKMIDARQLINGLDRVDDRFNTALRMYVETSCRTLEGYAREHAPWKDRSGAARQRLSSTYTTIANGYRIQLSHGVNYGVYLELAHEKNYAILWPSIEYVGSQQIMPSFRRFMERMGRAQTQ